MIRLTLETTGFDELRTWATRAKGTMLQAMGRALYAEALPIFNASQELVPVRTGALKATGLVTLPEVNGDEVWVVVGYGGPAVAYALAVHENPRSGRTGGWSPSGQRYRSWAQTGQWKYLEQPAVAQAEGFETRVAERLKTELTNVALG